MVSLYFLEDTEIVIVIHMYTNMFEHISILSFKIFSFQIQI